MLYVNGTGLDLNPALGYAWLSYAASQDYEPAVAAVNQLKGDMTLSDQEKSRQEFLHLQETVLGKVTAPIREEDLLEKKENTKSEETGRISRRRRRRRR